MAPNSSTPPTTVDLVPTVEDLINPILRALERLGGSGSIYELTDSLIVAFSLPPNVVELPHKGGRSVLEYRASWARTCLKMACLVDDSERGIWVLTPKGTVAGTVDPQELMRAFKREARAKRKEREAAADQILPLDESVLSQEFSIQADLDWRTKLSKYSSASLLWRSSIFVCEFSASPDSLGLR